MATSYRPVLVTERMTLADGVLGLTLRCPDGGALEGWAPGAHVDLRLPSGLIRQYSLWGDPADLDGYRIGVLREPASRGGSAELHDACPVGTTLAVSAPRNHFPLEPAHRYLFIAGGIGITPLLPMVRQLTADGASWQLLYGGRRRSSMAFLADLSGASGAAEIFPEDERGLLPLAEFLESARVGDLVYCCGPAALLTAVEEHCAEHLAPGSLRVERFSGTREDLDTSGDTVFEVELARRGVVVEIPADRSVLAVLRELDPDLPFSCEEGFCGTCETPVLAGTPEHRDTLLTSKERADGTSMMICVSRAQTARIVLDL